MKRQPAKDYQLSLDIGDNAQLDALVEHFRISRAEAIVRLIAKAAKRLK